MKKNLTLFKIFSIVTAISLLLSTSSNVFAESVKTNVVPVLSGFSSRVFAQGTSSGTKQPDDITTMGGNIFIGLQNGVGSDGAASSSGQTQSTIQEYDQAGNSIASWNITGKCDGLTADTANNRLIATVNEDGNSSMYIITPSAAGAQQVQHITYKAAAGQTLPAGGTDSIAIQNGNIYISASAPQADSKGNFTTAALFQAVINPDNTATLTPVLMDNATANDATPGAAAGSKVTLNMSDPDSNNIVPAESPKYAGQVVLDDQGDSKLIFTDKIGTPNQINTSLPIGNQINDIVWATSTQGTLYVTDTADNKIYAITGNFTKGTAFVAAPNDSGVGGFVGTIDLTSGIITPFAAGMKSPHGLLFVPSNSSVQAPPLTGAIPTVGSLTSKVFAQGTSSGTKQPDDITTMGGNIFIGLQNGVGSDGAAASSGQTQSTIQEYDQAGNSIASWNITGKCDGLTADTANNRLIATVNEDGNSSMYIITPSAAGAQQVQHIIYKAVAGQTLPAGGTDSIAIQNGNIYISASNPQADSKGNFTTAALFQAVINPDNTATLTPVLMDNATANDATPGATAGAKVTLNMSDPDSNKIVPAESSKYAGQVVLDDQGDSKLIFIDKIGTPNQVNTCLPIGDQIDDMAWATSTQGTLYVTDTADNKVYAITGNFTKGTAFVAAPNDSGVGGFVGTIDLTSGIITPVAFGMKSPHGLLFVPQTQQAPTNTTSQTQQAPTNTATQTQQSPTNTTTQTQQAPTAATQTVAKSALKGTLPQTGSTLDTTVFVIAGVILIAVGLLIIFKKKIVDGLWTIFKKKTVIE
ncbi:LPXTG cell wall anchor domain-containing protein [Clostridium pasteurianum]|uniref:Putative cell wall binding protein n=1 Tax=Clostridium pasteurianum BC1 TaxID=86416 RepID=R4K860_CLOPA|nr:LPXTG cell wall anchor domain-containing protein [Clostridium pasteurianum]AGK96709.1 putative cell wall binding protein [Clostridium pasteurianum BC1]